MMKKILFGAALIFHLVSAGVAYDRDGFSSFSLALYQSGDVRSPVSDGSRDREDDHWRAKYYIITVMGVSHGYYWLTYPRFLEDWDYKLNWRDQKTRLFTLDAQRFDSNSFGINWGHGLAGALWYNLARSHNIDWTSAFLHSTAASLYWEYVVEWREVVSVNDNIFTIFGALSCGESWFRLGRYFAGRPGFVYRILGLINPLTQIQAWRGDFAGPGRVPESASDGDAFRLVAGRHGGRGWGDGLTGPAGLFLGIRSEILSFPDYGKPGSFRRTVREPISSAIRLGWSFGRPGVAEMDFFSRAVLLGYCRQSIDPTGSGFGFSLGLGSALTVYRKRAVASHDTGIKVGEDAELNLDEPRNFRDKYAVIHLPGPVLDATWHRPRSKLRIIAEAYPDFSMTNALAFNAYSLDHDITGVKTTMLYHGYYYGFGGTLAASAEYTAGILEAQGSVILHAHASIQGLDRFQDHIVDDVSAWDTRWRGRLGAALKVPGQPLRLEAYLERIGRRGGIGDILAKENETRHFIGLSFAF